MRKLDTDFQNELTNIYQKNTKITKIFSGIALVVFGYFSVRDVVTGDLDYRNFILFGSAVFCGYWFFRSLRESDPAKNQALNILLNSPESIVKAKDHTSSVGGAASFNVRFYTVDGKSYTIPTVKKLVQEKILVELQQFISTNPQNL